jgi:hypothetical protein
MTEYHGLPLVAGRLATTTSFVAAHQGLRVFCQKAGFPACAELRSPTTLSVILSADSPLLGDSNAAFDGWAGRIPGHPFCVSGRLCQACC